MIEKYFEEINQTISFFRIIRTYSLSKKIYNDKQGYIKGRLIFNDDTQLEFAEVKNIDIKSKVMYRYHYMYAKDQLIFRCDNAKHHMEIKTYPHHKHIEDKVESSEINLFDILLEIQQMIRKK